MPTCGGHWCDDPLGCVSLRVHAVLGGARLHQGGGGEGADQDQGGQHLHGYTAGGDTAGGDTAGDGTTAGNGTAAGDGTAGCALVPPTHCSAVVWPCEHNKPVLHHHQHTPTPATA